MPGAFDDALGDEFWKGGAVLGGDLRPRMPERVVAPVQDDRRDRNRRPLRELLLHLEETWLAWCVEVAVAVRVNHAVHEVRVVERARGQLELLAGEAPGRRPLAPQQLGQRAPILIEPRAADLGVEVPLVPESARGLRWTGPSRRGGVLNRVAAD